MIEKNYLLKVLSLAGLPKLFSFGLSWLSFPLMLRTLGPENYGELVFISSSLSMFETLLDFGVATACGKSISEARVNSPWFLRSVLLSWARLQILTVVVGFWPMLFCAYLMVHNSHQFQDIRILWILASSVCFSVSINFIRSCLHSLLCFKYLAFLETTDSVLRSSGLLVVTFIFPTVLGLAYASLITAVTSSLLAFFLLISYLQKNLNNYVDINRTNAPTLSPMSFNYKITSSFQFLWLRIVTRLYNESPIILLGQFFGNEIVGIVAAARKVIDLITTPYLIIGNALMVRVHEIMKYDQLAIDGFFQSILYIISTSFFIGGLAYLGSSALASLLLPESPSAPQIFIILTPTLIAGCVAGLIAPMSDYLGGLKKRNVILTIGSVFQAILLIIVGFMKKEIYAIWIISITYIFLVFYYLRIALHYFTPPSLMSFRPLLLFGFSVFLCFSIAELLRYLFKYYGSINIDFISIFIYIILFFISLASSKSMKILYLSKSFFQI